MRSLNKETFNQGLLNRIEKVITDYSLIDPDEKVAVALSGGKDSVLTLHALYNFREIFNFELVAIAIDEGISGYRADGLQIARQHTSELGIELIEKSLKTEMDITLDQATNFYQTACIPCGVFRRYLLNRTANDLEVDKLATGHNLDDEIQSFLMSFARADTRRFAKFGPKLDRIHPRMIPRIKPLWKIQEKEVGHWVVVNELEVHMAECPYAHASFRSYLKNYLNQLEEKHPGTKMNILKSFQKSFQFRKLPQMEIELQECQRCREPSSSVLCKACEIREEIESNRKK